MDTSTWSGSVAIANDSSIQGEIGLQTKVTHSDTLMVAIDFLMKKLALSPEDMDGLAVSVGPGSFTGLRIGMSTAKGLAIAVEKPVIGISTLQAMAESFVMSGFLCPLIDAGRGEVYACCFQRNGRILKRITHEVVAPPIDFLKSLGSRPLHIFGTGADRYRTEIRMMNRGAYELWPFSHFIASAIARIGISMLKEKEIPPLRPNYIRKSDAELQREHREKKIG